MCLIAFALNAHPRWPLIMLANRDEFHDRPAQTSQWWHAVTAPDGRPAAAHPPVFGGRDLKAGGSWLVISPMRRLAALTNIRQPQAPAGRKSRGELVVSALNVTDLEHLDLSPYASFNLLQASPVDMGQPGGRWQAQYANSAGVLHRIDDGVHGMSNALLNTAWPKTQRLKDRLAELAPQAPETLCGTSFLQSAFALLDDRHIWPDHALPSTGVPLEWERMLSAACIVSPAYGTRCSTVVGVDSAGQVHWHERTRNPMGQVVHEVDQLLFVA